MKQNPFKVGEMVAAYTVFGKKFGRITSISEDGNCVQIGSKYLCHPKQLRRLKPKAKKSPPPKEVWVSYPKDFFMAGGKASLWFSPPHQSVKDLLFGKHIRYVLCDSTVADEEK